jgi:hypothetical protein
MADEETLKSPKYASVLTSMRALLPVVYVRMEHPENLPRLVSDVNKHWGFFHSTDPNTKSISRQMYARPGVAYEPGRIWPVKEGHTPLEVMSATMAANGLDEMCIAVIQIEDANTIPSIATQVADFVKRRLDDYRWAVQVYFAGNLPPSQAIPEDMRENFYPIDLIEGSRHEGTDSRVRKEPTTPEQARALVADHANALGMTVESPLQGQVSPLPLAYEPLVGLSRTEIGMSMNMSIVNTRKTGRVMFDPATLDHVRNRWARVG